MLVLDLTTIEDVNNYSMAEDLKIMVLVVLFCVLVIIILPYLIGLYFSRGYHKGKIEFVETIINKSCKEEEKEKVDTK